MLTDARARCDRYIYRVRRAHNIEVPAALLRTPFKCCVCIVLSAPIVPLGSRRMIHLLRGARKELVYNNSRSSTQLALCAVSILSYLPWWNISPYGIAGAWRRGGGCQGREGACCRSLTPRLFSSTLRSNSAPEVLNPDHTAPGQGFGIRRRVANAQTNTLPLQAYGSN